MHDLVRGSDTLGRLKKRLSEMKASSKPLRISFIMAASTEKPGWENDCLSSSFSSVCYRKYNINSVCNMSIETL